MPELPEVETVMQGVTPFLKNRTLTRIEVRSKTLRIPIPKAKLKSLQGEKIISLTRRAKYILVNFADHKTMIIHLGMTGSITAYPKGKFDPEKLDRHDHVIFETEKGITLLYRDPRRFGMIDVIKTDDVPCYKSFADLGPEPLEETFTAEDLQRRLSSRTIAIKPAIMDQSVVVGVGNIYASEALFLSRINPQTPANQLSKKSLSVLVENIKGILRAAIASGGSTLRDYRNAKGESGYFQFNFSVYDRAGEACPGCTCSVERTGGIQRIVQAGRSTFFCPTRQNGQKPLKNSES